MQTHPKHDRVNETTNTVDHEKNLAVVCKIGMVQHLEAWLHVFLLPILAWSVFIAFHLTFPLLTAPVRLGCSQSKKKA